MALAICIDLAIDDPYNPANLGIEAFWDGVDRFEMPNPKTTEKWPEFIDHSKFNIEDPLKKRRSKTR